MAKADIEAFLDNLETFLKTNLNTQITSLNNEKANAPQLDQVNSSAYYRQSTRDELVNWNPFCFYGIFAFDGAAIGPQTLKTYRVHVLIVWADDGNTKLFERLLRYQRVLEDLFESKWDRVSRFSESLEAVSLGPFLFPSENENENHFATGVELKVTLG